jgi:hypothetical protein
MLSKMDLSETWKKLEKERLEQPIDITPFKIPGSSKHPVAAMKRNHIAKSAFAIVFLMGFIIVFLYFDQPLIRGLLGVVILFYLMFSVSAVSLVNKLGAPLPADGSLKMALLHTKNLMEKSLRMEERMGLFVYPFCITSGFLMGLAVTGKNFDELIRKPYIGFILIGSIIVLTPLCYFLAKKMNQYSYGQPLNDLNSLIADLDRME